MLEHLFHGSALCPIGGDGRLTLPSFIRETAGRRCGSGVLLVAAHEVDDCLALYDRSYSRQLHADFERRRIAEESAAPGLHHARARKAFGFAVEAAIEADGSLVLPLLMRRRAGLGQRALLVGAGATFELWDPQRALDRGEPDLRELASFHLQFSQAA